MTRRSRGSGASIARPVLLVCIIALVLVSAGLVVASPLALRGLDGKAQDWSRLSDIGQTYGAVSAIIAAIALAGVVISVVIQSREARAARRTAQRGHQLELLRMAMDDPRYMEVWGRYLTDSFTAESQFTYANLIFSFWHAEYMLGEISDLQLRASSANVFASVPGRTYWQHTGTRWRDIYSGRRARRFYEVAEETYQEAIKQPPSTPPPTVDMSAVDNDGHAAVSAGRQDRGRLVAAAGVGAVLALVVRWVLRRR